jgi:hypothetical protein
MASDNPITTLRVTFGQSTGKGEHFLSAEIDAREEGPNAGQTSFAPGDTVWFLVYKGERVELASAEASAGSATLGDEIEITKSEDVVFDGSTGSVSLDRPALAIESVKWLGRSLGSLTLLADRQTLKPESAGVAVARVGYRARATQGQVTSPERVSGETDFSIAVVITGIVRVEEETEP